MTPFFNESQEMVRTSARGFLANNCPPLFVREMHKDPRGHSPALWKTIAALGWQGLAIPEEFGGGGEDLLTLGVLMEEMGRASWPSPFFSTAVLGALTVMHAASARQKSSVLPQICRGEMILTVALAETDGQQPSDIRTMAAPVGSEEYSITGTKLFVPYSHVSDFAIVAARTGSQETDISLFLVNMRAQGVQHTLLKTITGEKLCELGFKEVVVNKESIIGTHNRGWELLQQAMLEATLMKCFEMLGGSDQVLQLSVQHAKTRVQSGHPIGSFQAVQHHCANIVLNFETMKHLVYKAAWLASTGAECRKEVSMAKACCVANFRAIAYLGHQIHGAVAFCEDHAMPLYFKQMEAAEYAMGDRHYHLERVAHEMGL